MTEIADIEEKVVEALGRLGLEYKVLECDPDYADTAAFCERYGYSPDACGNTIIVGSRREPKQYSACVVKASTRLNVNRTVRKLMGVSRLSFASAEETMALTGMMIGGVTPFVLPEDLPIYVDDKVLELDLVILGSGSRSSKIEISPRVFEALSNAKIVPELSQI